VIVVAGIDEVGRGSIAGPLLVVAAAFAVESWPDSPCELHPAGLPSTCPDPFCLSAPPPSPVHGVKDSKSYSSAKRRESVAYELEESPQFRGKARGVVTSTLISERGMGWAIRSAFERAIRDLPVTPDLVLVDGEMPVPGWTGKQSWGPKGDIKWWPISAASVLAKVERDKWMQQLHQVHFGYGWDRNKGYGTPEHFKAVRMRGVTAVHRLSFVSGHLKSDATIVPPPALNSDSGIFE
jgi:ribonuclease HII